MTKYRVYMATHQICLPMLLNNFRIYFLFCIRKYQLWELVCQYWYSEDKTESECDHPHNLTCLWFSFVFISTFCFVFTVINDEILRLTFACQYWWLKTKQRVYDKTDNLPFLWFLLVFIFTFYSVFTVINDENSSSTYDCQNRWMKINRIVCITGLTTWSVYDSC